MEDYIWLLLMRWARFSPYKTTLSHLMALFSYYYHYFYYSARPLGHAVHLFASVAQLGFHLCALVPNYQLLGYLHLGVLSSPNVPLVQRLILNPVILSA
jgi:hypothetical protein